MSLTCRVTNRDSFEMASEEQEKYKRIDSFFKLVEVTNDKDECVKYIHDLTKCVLVFD